MIKKAGWREKNDYGFIYEKIVIFSILFLLTVLCVDCFFQKLPISGYGLVFITLFLIGCAVCITCHGIKWSITTSKPLYFYFKEKNENKKLKDFWTKYEDVLLIKFLKNASNYCDTFKYPTNLNEQIRLLLKDIERDFIKIWYSEISQNPSFLFDSHLILEELIFKIFKKLNTINFTSLLSTVLVLYLYHLQEYKKSIKKLIKQNADTNKKSKANLPDLWRYTHPGSKNDQIFNYYIKKMTKAVLNEFSSHEFSNSLECKILSGIIARKVMRKFILTLEDPTWINIKLIYIFDLQTYNKLLQEKMYCVREKHTGDEVDLQFKKTSSFAHTHIPQNIFQKDYFHEETDSGVNNVHKVEDIKVLTLPLTNSNTEERKNNVTAVLGGLISSTAGPFLPDNIFVQYQAFNKMWQSPVAEVKDFSESITSSFRKIFADGIKEKKGIVKSHSTESITMLNKNGLHDRDISLGEELCENVQLSSLDFLENASSPNKNKKKLKKMNSFDSDNLVVEVDGCDDENSSTELERNISPVYEETEDFATTIAKLRSLLQQRESSSTLSEKSNMSVDFQSADKSYSSNKSVEDESLEPQRTYNISSDGSLFTNIFIPKAELTTEGGLSYIVYSIQYDGIYMLKDEQTTGVEPELILQTAIVKRRFQDFLDLQTKLESNPACRVAMKGIKGPSKLPNVPFNGKYENSYSSSKKIILENFLRELCSKSEISNSMELHEFLSYGRGVKDSLIKKEMVDSSTLRIDKLLANKVTGVFNSIKTVLPSFDFESSTMITTNDSAKGTQEQKQIQSFLSFGSKPELFELNLSFAAKEPMGEALSDDIRHYLRQKSDCIEDAVDVLDSTDWLSEQRDCKFFSSGESCIWQSFKDATFDDELEPLDSLMPICSLVLDILSELLHDSDCWLIKEPVVRLVKLLFGHWESKLQAELTKVDWDCVCGNLVRLLRTAVFQSPVKENSEITAEETSTALKEAIVRKIPNWVNEFVKSDDLKTAVSLFVDSLQHFRLNRDALLKLYDILLAHVFSCRHLMHFN